MPTKWIEKYGTLRIKIKMASASEMVMESAEAAYERAVHVL